MTDFGKAAERIMTMDDRVWSRHANPWSVYTRIPILPLLALAIYSRAWIGAYAILPVALLAIWAYLNPRAFPPPESTGNWASKAVLGERVWLNRSRVPIPKHHSVAAQILTAVSLCGVAVLAYGLVLLKPWATVTGVVIATMGKLWFVDRMVWLYEDMRKAHPPYERWMRPPSPREPD